MIVAPAGTKSMQAFVENFWIDNIGPYSDEIKHGVTIAWDGNNYYASAFPNTDGQAMEAFSKNYLEGAIAASTKGVSTAGQFYANIASAMQKRSAEVFGGGAPAAAVTPEYAPEQKAAIAAASAKYYELGGEKVPGVCGAVGERELLAAQTGNEGGADYLAATYKTDDIAEDIKQYAIALNADGWALTQQEGTYEQGSVTLAKQSKDKGKILLITIEMKGASYKVNAAKMEGTLNLNK
jgi:hypothetical protein